MTVVSIRVGSLFSGVGGLDRGFHEVFPESQLQWVCENDPDAAKVLQHQIPWVPNLGDITKVDWSEVEPIDVLLAGFPCQDVSVVGFRKGMSEGTRSGLWSHVVTAIENLHPKLVIIENVRGLLSAKASRPLDQDEDDLGDGVTLRALGAVLGDLADLGFDAEWGVLPASAVGAPHRRERVFIAAAPAHAGSKPVRQYAGEPLAEEARSQESDGSRDHHREWPAGDRRGATEEVGELELLPTPCARDGKGAAAPQFSNSNLPRKMNDLGNESWGPYLPAIKQWSQIVGRTPPPALEKGRGGKLRLSAAFSEWMMGWPAGMVSDPDLKLGHHAKHRLVGNGVVSAQAAEAIEQLLDRLW